MRPQADRSSFLHAPVTAVSVSSSWFCLAVGHRVLASSVDDDMDHSSVFVVTELPNGAVITALEQHRMSYIATNELIISAVVIGSADRVYAAPLYRNELREGAPPAAKPHNSVLLLSLNNFARILYIQSLGDVAGILVLTTLNSAHVIPEQHLMVGWDASAGVAMREESQGIVLRRTVKGLGIALAASALMTADRCNILIFTGTYAGGVAVWSVPITSAEQQLRGMDDGTESLPVLSRISAHSPGCAVFAVKAVAIGGSGEQRNGSAVTSRICVATCSDDRTATVYVSHSDHSVGEDTCTASHFQLTEKTRWVCCWRGSRAALARRRLFDISILPTRTHSRVVVATGGEDGTVNVLCFNQGELEAAETPLKPQTIHCRTHQHEGSGVYKVALVEHAVSSGYVTAVVSCGFDGCVYYTRLQPSELRKATLIPCTPIKQRCHVRGLHCDDNGTLLACTEDEFIIIHFHKGDTSPHEQRFPLPTTCSGKKDVPSCLSAITSLSPPLVPSNNFAPKHIALIGTTGGGVYGVLYGAWYSNAAEKENGGRAPPTVVKLMTSSSKVLFVRGLQYQQHLVLATVHAGGQLVVSAFENISERSTEWLSAVCAGTHTTALTLRLMKRTLRRECLCILTGDDEGSLYIHTVEPGESQETQPLAWRDRLFQSPVAAVDTEEVVLPTSNSETRVTVLSHQGEWRALVVDSDDILKVDIRSISCPLLLPWRVSTVLAWSNGAAKCGKGSNDLSFAVTLFGTDITVFSRRPQISGWHPIAQCHEVRAPRLLTAAVSSGVAADGAEGKGRYAYVCHCSNGREGEWCEYNPENSSRLLYGGVATGRDYNTVIVLPEPAACILCGAEQSTVSVLSLPSKATNAMETPQTLSGPHESNILGMSYCSIADGSVTCGEEVRFVTVGSLATVAVWEWSVRHSWRVMAHMNVRQQRVRGNGDSAVDGPTATTSQCVPRFLSVCTTAKDIVVGGSDGALRIFGFTSKLILRQKVVLDPQTPRPVTAVCALSIMGGLVIAGDTGGALCVCCAQKGEVLSRSVWKKVAVDALSVEKQERREGTGAASWRVLAAMDSGDIVLVRASTHGIETLSSVRVGLTAGRGVSWINCGETESMKEHDGMAVAVNDERLTFLRIRGDVFHVAGERRVNVRGVSGLAIDPSASPPDMCVVVGQGVETVPLRWESCFIA
ncbi:hypothetical protein, conserved [Trypanosoma brucei gambiense DAL972]|uniref:Uncharacterized protein n=1 Tax=Trypanosoma brucei gambiense (strain MHOM/CI/86/DAL972) TaxID=679716 RepID=D0A8T0_TRYB9|nr:hypothetical protein, conserved [Trypanosoma brucei gambiense DAL972]CBH18081.1 hypothetical protein, conserved [Trypanosoma brucei gambiense DAL972]|eukprot:XP_011780345.1 hypothetical protein, conserved [Trypanosoma brucei gambiense DAL972]